MTQIFSTFRGARFIALLGLLFVLVAIYVFGITFDVPKGWIYFSWTVAVIGWTAYVITNWLIGRRASRDMESMFASQAEDAAKAAPTDKRQEIDVLKKRLLDAVGTIKNSKLGQSTGSAALYEMPWYIVIGNPAAGKSTAVLNSGLNFPFSDKGGQTVQGIGGTRNCDWFFTTEGILLDTAGRYAVQEEDREEWFGFLKLLRKYRPKAPINGIVIVASIAELTGNRPDVAIALARELRQRVQELTERLELFAPVYVVFTKVDLIAGFVDFFEDSDAEERSRVWGATLPYDTDGKANAVSLFDQHFDTLADGIKELGTTRMSLNRSEGMSPGVLTFPLEFIGVKHHLRTFIATLFEDNPYQFKPIFRGFYFTSAVQEGVATHATGERIVQQFGLAAGRRLTASISSNTGFFLKNLFSAVIFADRNLVRQYASRNKIRLRYAAFYSAVLVLGLAVGGWSWSFVSNRQYVTNIQADLEHAQKIQENRLDLASRLQALNILQDRLQQLQQYRDNHPLSLSFGLYQGDRVEHKLRAEYFKGLQQVLLQPVASNLEAFLTEVTAHAGKLEVPTRTSQGGIVLAATSSDSGMRSGAALYKDAAPTNAEDAYSALKTYLMLGNRDRIEPGHLNDQLTRFWRNWLENNRGNASREQIIRDAEKLISFYLAQANEADLPLIENKLALVDQVRDSLRPVVKGTPARERVYSEIRMRAATRFPIVTVASIVGEQHKDIVAGSHTVSGAFTRAAWEQYVEGAIKEASTKELQSTDWVLKTSVKDDLSLEGSPEQIQKELIRLYKADYINEWKKFMQGILIKDFTSFENAVQHMNVLGDPQSSPVSVLLQTLYRETSWDNPSLVSQGLQGAKRGLIDWFRETVLRQTPGQVKIDVPGGAAANSSLQAGVVGKEFAAIANLVVARGENKDLSLMKGYLDHLSKIRTRFNQIGNSGDYGPPSRQLMQATLDGNGSELADALKYIDENMLTGMPPAERATIRPLLVRPLMQAFAVIITPAEQELNRTWMAQVYDPFSKSLAVKYPFAADSRIEATPGEIAQVFGPDGTISRYVQSAMGPLVIRRGDTLAARTWADMGVRLNPEFSTNLARYVATQGGASSGAANSGSGQAQTNFQLLPIPTPGLTEYTVEIDGQTMRYRNGQQEWNSFTWPNALGQPGAKITAITSDGRTVDVVNFPGQFGLEKFINSAQRKKLDNGIFQMSWDGAGYQVAMRFRLISDARPGGGATSGAANTGLRGLSLPPAVVGKDSVELAAPAVNQTRS
jgi:type VI secretion system protein ImpL